MKGHAFDIYQDTSALIEGNVFATVTTPMTSTSSSGAVYDVPDSSSASACSSYLGRSCQVNSLSGSGSWLSLKNTAVLSTFQSYVSRWMVTPIAASSVSGTVLANAGIGKI
jgi:pectin lyase